jgi:succinate dehydrogenase / fumarate reductase iron-sulfur subunit
MAEAIFEVFRGDRDGGQPATYRVPIAPGMVVLDALHHIQAQQAPDLAVRWNCKAGKCGSCSAEVNGRPRLTCKTRLDALPLDKPITVQPMKAFPVIKDLVTDVSWNYRVNQKIPPFEPSGKYTRKMWIGCRSFASALNAFCARMCATFSASTRRWSISLDRGSSSG